MNNFFSTDNAELFSAENLAKFFTINSLIAGIGFQLAPDAWIKIVHNFEKSAIHEDARLGGAMMISYGLLPFLTVMQKVASLEAMAWSLVPIAAHLLYTDVVRSSKSASYKRIAAVAACTLLVCAYCLGTSGSRPPLDAAAWIPLVFLGTIASLQISFPDVMTRALEFVKLEKESVKNNNNNTQMEYRPRVMTQGIGMHSLIYLAQFFALWNGAGPLEAVGYSAIVLVILVVLIAFVGPNMRLSGAPLGNMASFAGIHAYMAWKMLS